MGDRGPEGHGTGSASRPSWGPRPRETDAPLGSWHPATGWLQFSALLPIVSTNGPVDHVALLASSGALAVASAKGVLVLVFRLMVRFSVPASNGANGSPSQA